MCTLRLLISKYVICRMVRVESHIFTSLTTVQLAEGSLSDLSRPG